LFPLFNCCAYYENELSEILACFMIMPTYRLTAS
jgi:hypothetical protein